MLLKRAKLISISGPLQLPTWNALSWILDFLLIIWITGQVSSPYRRISWLLYLKYILHSQSRTVPLLSALIVLFSIVRLHTHTHTHTHTNTHTHSLSHTHHTYLLIYLSQKNLRFIKEETSPSQYCNFMVFNSVWCILNTQ